MYLYLHGMFFSIKPLQIFLYFALSVDLNFVISFHSFVVAVAA